MAPWGLGFSELDVGGVVESGQRRWRPLPNRQERGIRAAGAPDGAGVGGDRPELQPEPREDAAMGVVHVLVFALEIGKRGVERVAILHEEFPFRA